MKYNAALATNGQDLDLCRIALDMLAIPSMSSECERVFSSIKLIISDRRNRLKVSQEGSYLA
jgi:hypothetical protein